MSSDHPDSILSNCCSGPDKKKKQIYWCGGISAVVLCLIIIIALSFKKLTSTEFGIEYTPYSKKLDDAAKTGGLHTGPPGFEFVIFPSTFITEALPKDVCLSRDGLPVSYTVTFQYQILADNLLPAILKYRNFEKWAGVVANVAVSAVQHTCSEFEISAFQNQRGVIQTRMQENVRLKLEGDDDDEQSVGVFGTVVALQLESVEIPEAYKEAVAEKQAAAEDIGLAKNQRNQELTKANTLLFSAREEARKINDTATNDAEVTLTKAELQAEETTFAFTTESEILQDAIGSFNLTSNGVLAYLSNRMYAGAKKLSVSANEPARLSRRDEL